MPRRGACPSSSVCTKLWGCVPSPEGRSACKEAEAPGGVLPHLPLLMGLSGRCCCPLSSGKCHLSGGLTEPHAISTLLMSTRCWALHFHSLQKREGTSQAAGSLQEKQSAPTSSWHDC